MVERVARRGPKQGEKFLGCRAYPQCRGTRPLAPPTAPGSAPPGHAPGEAARDAALDAHADAAPARARTRAGASARATYERREATHRARVHSLRGRILAIGATGVVVGLAWWASGRAIDMFQPVFGVYLALFAIVWTLGKLYGTPQHIRAWRTGAGGEEKTADHLDRLGDGWVVLHDRRIPGSKANIDHVAIGPPGVFVIETKDYAGRLTVRRGEVRIDGRRRAVIDQVGRQIDAVERALASAAEHDVPVGALICVHRADLPWRTPVIDGVAIVSGREMVRRLAKATPRLTPAEVERVAEQLDRALPSEP